MATTTRRRGHALHTAWKGSISFGMVLIPVRMYKATESSNAVSFRTLCPKDGTPIQYKKWCPLENHELEGQPLRGFEVGKEQFVILSDNELDDLPLTTAHTIRIDEFVDPLDAALLFAKGVYYLEPEEVGQKAYALLERALVDTGTVAVGKIAQRDREHLCRVSRHDHGLMLEQLYYPSEVRDASVLDIDRSVELTDEEAAMAVQLVEHLRSEGFDAARYRDDYRMALETVVAAKLANLPMPQVEAPRPAPDLMAALKASLQPKES
jgi:DNA end-binding protein Ku